jgi:hypothetical protein
MSDSSLAGAARKKAEEIRAKLPAEYYDRAAQFYAFSRSAGGTLDHTATIFPAVAWWSGTLSLPDAGSMLSRWASAEFSTDWGTRDISRATSFYDPISYHQGSVWPLFTGWVSLAEYRAGRPLAGYQHLMQNAGLTWSQDLGAVTELLSGEFFQPLGRSSSHQVWSSAMVLTPAVRGLFGIECDALHHTIHVAPNLPAEWTSAQLRNVSLGGARIDLDLAREGGRLVVRGRSLNGESFCLNDECANHEISIPLPAVEIGVTARLPLPGSRTAQLKVVDERREANLYAVVFEGQGGMEYELPVRLNRTGVSAKGAALLGDRLRLKFPEGDGYHRINVEFEW